MPAEPLLPRPLQWIVLGLVIWGSLMAVGAYRLNAHLGRFGIVLGCVAGFLGMWLLSLVAFASRRRRQARQSGADTTAPLPDGSEPPANPPRSLE